MYEKILRQLRQIPVGGQTVIYSRVVERVGKDHYAVRARSITGGWLNRTAKAAAMFIAATVTAENV